VIWFVLGVLFGVVSALFAGRWLDRALTILSLIGISTPVFFLAAVALYFLASRRGSSQRNVRRLTDDPLGWLSHMILPWLVLSVLFIRLLLARAALEILDTTNETTCARRARRASASRKVLWKHVVRTRSSRSCRCGASTFFAAVVGGGAILTESAFSLPGVGNFAAQSISRLDVPPVLVIVMFGAFLVVAIGGIVDVVSAMLDPRIRLEGYP